MSLDQESLALRETATGGLGEDLVRRGETSQTSVGPGTGCSTSTLGEVDEGDTQMSHPLFRLEISNSMKEISTLEVVADEGNEMTVKRGQDVTITLAEEDVVITLGAMTTTETEMMEDGVTTEAE